MPNVSPKRLCSTSSEFSYVLAVFNRSSFHVIVDAFIHTHCTTAWSTIDTSPAIRYSLLTAFMKIEGWASMVYPNCWKEVPGKMNTGTGHNFTVT